MRTTDRRNMTVLEQAQQKIVDNPFSQPYNQFLNEAEVVAFLEWGTANLDEACQGIIRAPSRFSIALAQARGVAA